MKTVLVVAALIHRANKILVVKREENHLEGSKWEFPGGKVNAGEDPREALEREIMEELSVRIDVSFPVDTSSAIIKENHYVMVLYSCKMQEGEIDLKVGQEYRWIDSHELDKLQLAILDVPMVPAIKRLLN